MLYISDETLKALCEISEDKAGLIIQMVVKHHFNKEPLQINDNDNGVSLSAFIILQEHNKYFEKKKTISEIRSKSRKGK